MKLERLQIFVTVVDHGSYELAAVALASSADILIEQLGALETELGKKLLVPGASPVAVTDAGYRFYESCTYVLAGAEAALEDARAADASLTGVLRVTSTVEYGVHFLVPALAELASLHPALKVQLSTSAAMDDLRAARCDVAVYTGRLRSSTDRAALLGRFRVVAIGSPDYLRSVEAVQTPHDLRRLQWIAHAGFDAPYTWVEGGSQHKVALDAKVQADNALAVLAFVLARRGVAILPEWLVADALADGAVVEILPAFKLTEHGVFAVYPDPDQVPDRVRAFVELLRRDR